MKCKDVMLLLDDDLDDRLNESDAAALDAHLGTCEICSKEHRAAIVLREEVADLPDSINPSRDLWPAIDASITAAKVVRVPFGRRALVAAAAVVFLVGSVVTAYMLGRRQASPVASTTTSSENLTTDILLASFAEIGVHDYEATRAHLLNVLEDRRDELEPATLDVVLTNLRLIDEAMEEIARALGEDPGNELLTRQLVTTYRRQISLLERAANLPSEV